MKMCFLRRKEAQGKGDRGSLTKSKNCISYFLKDVVYLQSHTGEEDVWKMGETYLYSDGRLQCNIISHNATI